MNREILFRGFHKCEDGKETIYIDGQSINGKWIEGFYWTNGLGNYFIRVIKKEEDNFSIFTIEDYEVIPETVGQYTGLDDKNGKLIFENDVVKYDSGMGGYETSIIYYDEYQLSLNIKTTFGYFYNGLRNLKRKQDMEVIGTIFDKEVK